MRQQVLDKLKEKSFNGIRFSNELPFNESGIPLYLKNPKTLYVDQTQYEPELLFATLDGHSISNTATVVRVYFTTDAKKLPANYDTLVAELRTMKDEINFDGAFSREAFVSTAYEGDLLVTELEYRLTRFN